MVVEGLTVLVVCFDSCGSCGNIVVRCEDGHRDVGGEFVSKRCFLDLAGDLSLDVNTLAEVSWKTWRGGDSSSIVVVFRVKLPIIGSILNGGVTEGSSAFTSPDMISSLERWIHDRDEGVEDSTGAIESIVEGVKSIVATSEDARGHTDAYVCNSDDQVDDNHDGWVERNAQNDASEFLV